MKAVKQTDTNGVILQRISDIGASSGRDSEEVEVQSWQERRAAGQRRRAGQTANDDIGEDTRLSLYRMQYLIRQAEQRAFDLFLQNLVKGTSHLSLGQEAVAAGFAQR